jgi:hypothetical protein
MQKFRVLVELLTLSRDPTDTKKSNGTGGSHQLIECDTRQEAEDVYAAIPQEAEGGVYMRRVWKLYR